MNHAGATSRVAACVERLTAGVPGGDRVQIAVVFGPNLIILLSQLQSLLIFIVGDQGPSIKAGRRRFRARSDDSLQSD
jgi:hypothetical protein